jgi:hypothetical protein
LKGNHESNRVLKLYNGRHEIAAREEEWEAWCSFLDRGSWVPSDVLLEPPIAGVEASIGVIESQASQVIVSLTIATMNPATTLKGEAHELKVGNEPHDDVTHPLPI